MGITSVQPTNTLRCLMTSLIKRPFQIQTPMKSRFTTTEIMDLKPVRCWIKSMSLRRTVRKILVHSCHSHTEHIHIYSDANTLASLCVLSPVKLNTPCCLTVSHNASQHHFTWMSTYEEYIYTELVHRLMFELHYYTRGEGPNVRFSIK